MQEINKIRIYEWINNHEPTCTSKIPHLSKQNRGDAINAQSAIKFNTIYLEMGNIATKISIKRKFRLYSISRYSIHSVPKRHHSVIHMLLHA